MTHCCPVYYAIIYNNKMLIFEEDDGEMRYTLWFSASDMMKSQIKYRKKVTNGL